MGLACMLGLCLALSLIVVLSASCQRPSMGDSAGPRERQVAVRAYFNVPYDQHAQTRVHLFVPDGAADCPLVVYIHGGGWTGGNLDQYDAHCVRTACEGFAAATIEYRFLHSVSLAEIVADVARACAFLCSNAGKYGYDGTRVFLAGSSAGGHLALVAAGRWRSLARELDLPSLPPPMGVIAQCPVTTLEVAEDADKDRWRPDNAIASEPFEQVSPMHIPPGSFPPVLVQHGDADNLVPQQDSLRFVEQLQKAGVPAELLSLSGVGHAFGYNLAMPPGQQAFDSAMSFIRQQLAST